eukprot:1158066-Pelagomonas_calceolata.AAC.9
MVVPCSLLVRVHHRLGVCCFEGARKRRQPHRVSNLRCAAHTLLNSLKRVPCFMRAVFCAHMLCAVDDLLQDSVRLGQAAFNMLEAWVRGIGLEERKVSWGGMFEEPSMDRCLGMSIDLAPGAAYLSWDCICVLEANLIHGRATGLEVNAAGLSGQYCAGCATMQVIVV